MARRVIVTRPQAEVGKWVQALQQAGMDAQALPLIAIEPVDTVHAIEQAWKRLAEYDALMFVSGNAVSHFYAQKPALAPDLSALCAIKTRAFATGPGTVDALLRAGVAPPRIDAPDAQAGQFDSEALWSRVAAQVVPGYRVLIVRGADAALDDPSRTQGVGRNWFADQVQAAGGQVDMVVTYRRCPPHWTAQTRAMAHQGAHDGSVWLFSSSEAVAHLLREFPAPHWQYARAVATHARIAQAARAAGFAVVCESRPALADLVASIESLP